MTYPISPFKEARSGNRQALILGPNSVSLHTLTGVHSRADTNDALYARDYMARVNTNGNTSRYQRIDTISVHEKSAANALLEMANGSSEEYDRANVTYSTMNVRADKADYTLNGRAVYNRTDASDTTVHGRADVYDRSDITDATVHVRADAADSTVRRRADVYDRGNDVDTTRHGRADRANVAAPVVHSRSGSSLPVRDGTVVRSIAGFKPIRTDLDVHHNTGSLSVITDPGLHAKSGSKPIKAFTGVQTKACSKPVRVDTTLHGKPGSYVQPTSGSIPVKTYTGVLTKAGSKPVMVDPTMHGKAGSYVHPKSGSIPVWSDSRKHVRAGATPYYRFKKQVGFVAMSLEIRPLAALYFQICFLN